MPPRAAAALRLLGRSRRGRLAVGATTGSLALGVSVLAVRRFTEDGWPLDGANPGLVAGVGVLFLVGYAFKAVGWRRLFAADERPGAVSLAAANGGASVTGMALPGRLDDVVRIAIVRRFRGCPANVRTLGLSLFVLGLIDAVALVPLALAAAVVPGSSIGIRAGLAVIAFAGVGAAGVVIALPRLLASRRIERFRLARWIAPRAPALRPALEAWALVFASWLVRAVALFLLLHAVGIGLSFPLAMVYLCAGAASAALPVGPAGGVMQAGAGAAVLVASGIPASEAVAFAVAAHALLVLAGASVVVFAALSRSASGLAGRIGWRPSLSG